jgi:hypothetical protein
VFYSLLFSALTPVFHPFALISIILALIVICKPFSNLNCNAFDKFMFKLNILTTGYLWNNLSRYDFLLFETYSYLDKDTRITKRMSVRVLEKTKYHITLQYAGDDLRSPDYPPINIIKTVDSGTFIYKIIPHWRGLTIRWNGKPIKVIY